MDQRSLCGDYISSSQKILTGIKISDYARKIWMQEHDGILLHAGLPF